MPGDADLQPRVGRNGNEYRSGRTSGQQRLITDRPDPSDL
jgi:hypothetical protein